MLKIKLFLILSISVFSNVTKAESGCPDGMMPGGLAGYGNPSGCMPIPEQQPQAQGYWVESFGAVAFAVNASDAWVATNYRDKASAEYDALRACQQFDKNDKCQIGTVVQNGYIAIVRTGSGTLMSDAGSSARDVKAKLKAYCELENIDCYPIHDFASKPWIEYGAAVDMRKLYAPKDVEDLYNRYAGISWTGNGDQWSTHVWAASGYSTMKAAQTAALNHCKKDAGDFCNSLSTTVANGFIAVAGDDLLQLRASVGKTERAAKDRALLGCKKANRKCKIILVVDSRKVQEISAKIEKE